MNDSFPSSPDDLVAHVLSAYEKNDLENTQVGCEQILQLGDAKDRDKALAWQLLGLNARSKKSYKEAIHCFKCAIELQPEVPELRFGLADLYMVLAAEHYGVSHMDEAERYAREALRWHGHSVKAINILGVVLQEKDQLLKAQHWFEQGLKIAPGNPQLLLNYADLLLALKQGKAAVKVFKKALALRPNHVITLLNFGAALNAIGQEGQAVQLLRRAVQLDPGNSDVHFNLATVYAAVYKSEESARHYEKAYELRPAMVTAQANALRQRAEYCDWRDDWDQQVRQLIDNQAMALEAEEQIPLNLSQMGSFPMPCSMMRQAACWQTKWLRHQKWIRGDVSQPSTRTSSRNERLRVGYFSHDFRHHASGHLTCSMFAYHDRQKIEVFTYSYGPDDKSHYRQRIQAGSEHFIDLDGADDHQIIDRILADEIDILVDLCGYVRNGRPDVLLARPAPLLVHYLGHPSTLGGLVDYFITDPVLIPPDSPLRDEFEEALIYLPDTYQMTDDEPPVSYEEVTRSQYGLPEDSFVFVAINNSYKIQPEIFSVWMEILKAVPGSVLWLLMRAPQFKENLSNEALRQGIDPSRLVFSKVVSKPEHLARCRLGDLFLDTTICGAHTTATDSLWAGVPVITCPGERFTERVAASLLTAAGLQELIVDDLGEYRQLAIDLARDRQRYQSIREEWQERRLSSPLFDTSVRVKQLEQAYEIIWERHSAGHKPQDVTV
ncbi:MAG: tetratricopeptide repeat protein [Desulfobulbaceae bacterium]|nr:tetratricopeptide repeat protein [Desulfobulbaceae bacterium]